MDFGKWLGMFLLGAAVAMIAAWWIRVPGYMDAEYYYATGEMLAAGEGFQEPFLWNYLDDPVGIPHPSHTYWKPLTSLLAAGGISLFGGGFRAAQIPFLILSAMIPGLTAFIAERMHGDWGMARFSGILAAFSGFFFPYFVTTDTFAIYALLGGAFFWVISEAYHREGEIPWLIVGILAALAQLTRADGLLLLILAVGVMISSRRSSLRLFIALLAGYFAVMLPWWITSGQRGNDLLFSGSARILWARSYDDIFAFPPEKLTFARWWASGLGEILIARMRALGLNLQSLLAVNGVIILGPLMVLGGWKKRNHLLVRVTAIFLLALLGLMSFIFPFAGARGGYFHSSSAGMLILWVLAPLGLHAANGFAAKRRGWNPVQTWRVFQAATIIIAGLISLRTFYVRVIGPDTEKIRWEATERAYQAVGKWFYEVHPDPALIAVNNPPGFYTATGYESLVIPDGDPQVLAEVVKRFEVGWVVLDRNNPGLKAIYENPTEVPWLTPVGDIELSKGDPILIFKVASSGENLE
jgi:hypothetical protein